MAMDGMSTSPAGLSYHNGSDFYPRKLGPKPDVVPSGVTERKVGAVDKPDMVAVDVINFQDSDTPVHRKKQETDTYVLGTIHPFRKTHKSFLGKFVQEFRLVASDRRPRFSFGLEPRFSFGLEPRGPRFLFGLGGPGS
ncbi:hypothetical protein NFI96_029426 [Prochilodus magdalenae]|nr:hypothetical protein NFI96_029426 [Prochilodus magdalenae]